jgi:DNA invertase Pin-like site-specific DNA recombinase
MGIKIIIADMQNHSTLEYNIRAVIAQEEREKISIRTKEALAAAKARGVKLGNPRLADSAGKGRQTLARRASDYAKKIGVVVKDLEAQGIKSLNGVGRGLEARGILTPRGCKNWSDMQVSRLLKRVRNDKPEASQKQAA